jgi:nitrite reductase (cytochrome c-552)
MSDKMNSKKLPGWAGGVIVLLVAAVVAVVGLMLTSIAERRWEALRPILVSQEIDEFESDNAVWGADYPNEFDAYKRMKDDNTKTRYGGGFPRDYLDADPRQVILFAKYGFSKDFLQARGHTYAIEDISKTKRVKHPTAENPDVYYPGTCWTCKSPDVPRMMGKFGKEASPQETDPIKLIAKGAAKFYSSNWHDLKKDMKHPIGCLDCHDPKTMKLRITRPALREGFKAMGKDIDKASHQEMRSLVCAQCHVEYYFKQDPATEQKDNYLTFPWAKGTSVEGMIEYYDDAGVKDFVHPISKVEIIKAQHPDWEMYSTGVHAYRKVSCADCHMPYKSEGGMKFTDHHVQSPLLNIANSCGVCHRWSEEELRTRVGSIQSKIAAGRFKAEDAIVAAHFDVAAAMEAKASDEELAPIRKLIRHAQFRWDYVAANNGMGFHSPQEAMRILGDSINNAQTARIQLARLLATKGVTAAPKYPNISTRAKAKAIADRFIAGNPPKLLP